MRRFAYAGVLCACAALVLGAFLKPTRRHIGINEYHRVMFLDLLDGRAHRPWAFRVLLPATVRAVVAVTPDSWETSAANLVRGKPAGRRVFDRLHWEIDAAYPYAVACSLMFLCLVGFGHAAALLVVATTGAGGSWGGRTLVAAVALLTLPPYFRYSSFVHDPPQLLLFTTALVLLARGRRTGFLAAYALCCFNKETALLLIPIHAFTQSAAGERNVRATTAAMAGWFLLVRAILFFMYADNPGSAAEFHLLDHNLKWLTQGWTFGNAVTVLVLALLVTHRWREKPPFLRTTFVWTAFPLLVASMFLGYWDEWRAYYEAHAAGLALAADTLRRVSGRSSQG